MARVLVVDDDPVILELVKEMLEGAGHAAVAAANGRSAMELVKDTPVEVVLTDILMPDKDGLEFIRELRRDCPQAKIIAMSGGGSLKINLDFLQVAKRMGAVFTLQKPFTPQALIDAVDCALASSPSCSPG